MKAIYVIRAYKTMGETVDLCYLGCHHFLQSAYHEGNYLNINVLFLFRLGFMIIVYFRGVPFNVMKGTWILILVYNLVSTQLRDLLCQVGVVSVMFFILHSRSKYFVWHFRGRGLQTTVMESQVWWIAFWGQVLWFNPLHNVL